MPTPQELKQKLWNALKSDMTLMLGVDGVEDGHARPMTAQVEDDSSPIWFFSASDNTLVQNITGASRAIATFASKDHELFASLHGPLHIDSDRAVIDRLWNPYVAAWYEGGKDDPKLRLIRFDAEHAQIWENATTLYAGIKLLLGVDPKKEYQDKVAEVPLR
jgi:general stress protein 26